MARRKFWPLVSLLSLSVLAGCGGGTSSITPSQPTPAAKPDFLYVQRMVGTPPSASFEIGTFKVDPSTGTLTSTATTPMPQLGANFVADPAGKYLYISEPVSTVDVINIFSIDPGSGAPTQTGQYIPPTVICSLGCPPPVNGPGPLTMDPAGKFLFYGSESFGPDQVVGALAVDGAGNLSSIPGSPFPADNMPAKVRVHPTGHFVYTENIDPTIIFGNTTTGTDPPPSFFTLKSISGFSVASNGALVAIPGSPFTPPPGASLADLIFHPSGKFVYLTSGDFSTILAWSIDPTTGALTVIPAATTTPGTFVGTGVMHPSGKFLYIPDMLGGIAAFSIDSNTGILTPLSGSPFATGQQYISMAIDSSGQFLFVGDLTHSTIVEYKIDATTGSLTASGSAMPAGGQPNVIQIVQAP